MNHDPGHADPSSIEIADIDYITVLFQSAADSLQQSIASRPTAGLAGSPYCIDFKADSLGERSFLTFAMPGALGLLQEIRGNARALALLYGCAGPALIDPAPFELMRGIWEKSLMTVWLLDGALDSGERVGRLKGWVEQGVSRASTGPDPLPPQTKLEIEKMLDECPDPAIQPLGWVDLSKRYHASGETVYRRLSGLLHGRVWSVIQAFETEWDDGGHSVTWRGYPLSLHKGLALPIIQVTESAKQTVSSYFGIGSRSPAPSTRGGTPST